MSDAQEIQSYEARVRWRSVLDQVAAGRTYIVLKRHQAIAAIVPLEEWQRRQTAEDSAEARELDELIRQLNDRHAETMAHLDTAFAAMADTRKALAEMSAERRAAQ